MNVIFVKLVLEKSQLLNVQFSYSPLPNGISLKSIRSKVLSVTNCSMK